MHYTHWCGAQAYRGFCGIYMEVAVRIYNVDDSGISVYH